VIGRYKVPPGRRKVALVRRDGRATFEDGRTYQLSGLPADTTIFASRSVVRAQAHRGRGELVRWAGLTVRWRVDGREVIALGAAADDTDDTLQGLIVLRDWLQGRGTTLKGSLASASKSLWRATTDRDLMLRSGTLPPIREVIGGRQGMFMPCGYVGPFRKIDLPAAYASEIGGLHYGGSWVRRSGLPAPDAGLPCFVHAAVEVPPGIVGPLPVRARARPKPRPLFWTYEEVRPYPVGRTIQGTWTAEEVRAAEAVGARVRVLDVWVHRAAGQPFARWWEAIGEARRLPGRAGVFGKIMGNALWGSFALNGERRIVRYNADGVKVSDRPDRRASWSPWTDLPLAETISGRIRARLYTEAIVPNLDRGLVAVHTDGAIIGPDGVRPKGWRTQERGDQLVIWDQSAYAYVNERGSRCYVMAGVTPGAAVDHWRGLLELMAAGSKPRAQGVWEGMEVVV
jgi:hypothetical protein